MTAPRGARGVGGALTALTVAVGAVLALRRLDNTDTWWHLAAGRWIAEHRRVPWLDPLSYTAHDHPWINVQWLFDLLLYGLYLAGGPSLLVVLSAVVWGSAIALMLVNVRRHVGGAAASALGIVAIVVAQERFAIRPEMVTYLLLQVTLWLYATGRRPDDRRLWALPAVMAVWANCHSLFVVGAVVIACHMASAVVTGQPWLPAGWRSPLEPLVRRRIVATGLVAIAATLLNPFGWRGATFPLALLGRFDRSHLFVRAVGEFQPPFSGYLMNLSVGTYQVLFVLGGLAVAAAVLLTAWSGANDAAMSDGAPSRAERRRAVRKGERLPVAPPSPHPGARLELATVVVFVAVAYLSVLGRRNMALFAMAGLPGLASALAVLGSRLPSAGRTAAVVLQRMLASLLAPGLVAFGIWVASNGFYRWNGDLHETGLGILDLPSPVHASAFAKAEGLPGPVYNDVTAGGYLTWDAPVPGGVYVDGRLEVYDGEFLDDVLRRLGDMHRWQDEVDGRGVQTVVVCHWWGNMQRLVRHLFTDRRWSPVYYDEAAVVAVRTEGNAELIARARASFRAARERTEHRLLEPAPSWQVPIRRSRGLEAYANLLTTIGKRDEAARYRAALAR